MPDIDIVGYLNGEEIARLPLTPHEHDGPLNIDYTFAGPLSIPGPGLAQAWVEERATGVRFYSVDQVELTASDVYDIASPFTIRTT